MQIVLLNVAVSVIVHIAMLLSHPELGTWLTLPSSWTGAILRPWTVASYMFVHFDIMHLICNMLCLYCFGIVALDLMSARRFVVTYIAGGITGAVTYLLTAAFVPSPGLIGSSAAVMAVAAATVVTKPDYHVNLWLFGMVKIKWVALFYLAFALLTTHADASALCAHAAHLGGIVAGVMSAVDLRRGLFRFRRRKAVVLPPLHTRPVGGFDERRLDELLDRVRMSGYQSLSNAEKEELNRLSNSIKR